MSYYLYGIPLHTPKLQNPSYPCNHAYGVFSACNYTVSMAMPSSFLPLLNQQTNATSLTECAVNCAAKNCTGAIYSSRSKSGNCLLSTRAEDDNKQICLNSQDEIVLSPTQSLPLRLQCVKCENFKIGP